MLAHRLISRLLRRLAICVGCAFAAWQLWALMDALSPPGAYARDFGQEYLLARVFLDGGDPYLPIRTLAERYTGVQGYLDKTIPTPHPPTAGLLLVPLGMLDYLAAVRVWFAVQLTSLFGSVYFAARVAGLRASPVWLAVMTLLLVAWQPVLLDLGLGQVTLPIVCLLAMAEFALLRQHPRTGGVLLGMSLLLKPLAWPWLLVLARRGNWWTVASAAAVLLMGYGLVGLRLGFGTLWDYVGRVLPEVSAGYALEPTNISLWTLGPRLLQANSAAASVLSACIVGTLLVGLWTLARPSGRLETALGSATALSVVSSPIAWLFYLTLTLVPAAHVLGWLRRHAWPIRATLVALAIGVALSMYWPTWLALGTLAGALQVGPGVAVLVLAGFLVTLEAGINNRNTHARQSLADHARPRKLHGHA